ncbi:DUF2604 domain-containing protein [Ensifer sp. ENS07]|uniref:DUF2604 domain-containing protein n=1 Tax=unclassified Ensifer TaxID=2633371 RepID=UPI0017848B2D|nr:MULTISPECIES: DUF2604 domain-containing protein [unclassified Ensifer]MBD9507922.1 DUF2604 domain-containing protein [Ensifer sp. ENS10]MBD9637581.1 DUF2604 domain-containing protein [Ensifer sp. ENS07]
MTKTPKAASETAGKATGSKNKISLTFVVNGEPVSVEANVNAPLQTAIAKALEVSGNVGQPAENWELKNEDGTVFDPSKKIEDLGITGGQTLFLSLKAGAAG